MSQKLLFVDDDPKLLSGLRRLLGFDYEVETALGGEEALELVRTGGPFAVIVSDMRMPGMDGIAVLEAVADLAPNTVRVMLTGNVDQATAVEAVNTGKVFRFLNKPVDAQILDRTLKDCLKQYELVTARKDLLEKTLSGSMRLLTDILSMGDPTAFGRSQEIRDLAKKLCRHAQYADSWHIEIAAMMASLGTIALPSEVAAKMRLRQHLNPDEEAVAHSVPRVGYDLLRKIPHLDQVAKSVLYQHHRWDGVDAEPGDPIKGDLPLGARVLRLLQDLQELIEEGSDIETGLRVLTRRKGMYDPQIMEDAFHALVEGQVPDVLSPRIKVSARCLKVGQVVAHDVTTKDGGILVSSGCPITPAALERVRGFVRLEMVCDPVEVFEDRAA